MKTTHQQSMDSYLDSVQNIEDSMVDPTTFGAIKQQITKVQNYRTDSWMTIPKYKYIAASVVFVILINLMAIIKFSSEKHGPDAPNITSKMLVDEYFINR